MRPCAGLPQLRACLAALVLGAVPGTQAAVSTQRVASGLALPVFVTAPSGDARLFIVEQGGTIRILENGSVLGTPFLDVSAELGGAIGGNDERGLLGLAFPPDFDQTGFFYVNYARLSDDHTIVARYKVSDGNPNLADTTDLNSPTVLLDLAQPFRNHNGGTLAFGPDGMLYIGLGDGGSAADPANRAQDDSTLLGKMLRIDVSGGLGSPYTIPPDNPFAGPGDPLDEIWAKGLRNPYRFSFDRQTGDLYIGDVGQSTIEEVDVQSASSTGGENYGWRLKEGTSCFNPDANCDPGGLTDPVHTYTHGGSPFRCSITGGSVYRGSITELRGHYLFADFCSDQIWSFVWDGAGGVTDFQERTGELAPSVGSIENIAAFGEDGSGELYIVDRGSGTNGEIYRIGDDSDGDGVPDGDGIVGEKSLAPCTTGQTAGCDDNCPFEPNASGEDMQRDSDGNGRGDACECGNVDRNTTLDIFDALHIAQGTLTPPLVEMIHPRACDADGNGTCDIFDALRVAQATLVPPLDQIVQECEAALIVAMPSSVVANEAADGLASIMDSLNVELAGQGADYRVAMAEYITNGEVEEANTVLSKFVGNKQLPFDFVPFDARRAWSNPGAGSSDNITYTVDQTGDAVPPFGGLSGAQTTAAIDRAMDTWDRVNCSTLPITLNPNFGIDIGVVAFLNGLGGSPFILADVQHAGWRDINFVGGILGVTFTFGFTSGGVFTDIDNNGKLDTVFREIYYDPSFNWTDDGVTNIDVETVALHEAGHGLSQAHFGKVWLKNNGTLKASPRAVMNALYTGPLPFLLGTDNGGHCSNWANWPNN